MLGMPWTQTRRRQLLASRVGTTVAVVSLMRRLQKAPRVLVSASAVGFYGASPNASMEPLNETAPPRPGEFQSDLCAAIEHEARRAEALGVRVVRMRFGVVLGHGGGAYPMQALSARLGLGASLRLGFIWPMLWGWCGLRWRTNICKAPSMLWRLKRRRKPYLRGPWLRRLADGLGCACRGCRCGPCWEHCLLCCWTGRTRCRVQRWVRDTVLRTRS